MGKGIVYIMTNPCLNGWVKIGMTERDNIAERLKELNMPSNIPLSFRCFATYEVENATNVEKKIHNIIDAVDETRHAIENLANGKNRIREFFRMSPEAALAVLRNVASLRNEENNIKLFEPTVEDTKEEAIAERKLRNSNNSFKELGIDKGTELAFLPDNSIIVKVMDGKNEVEYQGVIYTLSSLASKLLVETQGWSDKTKVNGWRYFMKDGVVLNDLRSE